MISVFNLTKVYNNITVLNIQDLSIPKGQSFGLVGNNGAGKTTFFRLVLDLVKADSGKVMINQASVEGNDDWKSVTGSFLDSSFLIDFLTPEEYFYFIGGIYHLNDGDISSFLQGMNDFFNDEVLEKNKYIRELSRGNQQKVGIAAALMGRPELLVLDEPFNGLDPSTQIRLKKLLRDLQNEMKMTMLISSHDLNHVTEVCDRIVVLEKGEMVHDMSTSSDTLKELESYFAV